MSQGVIDKRDGARVGISGQGWNLYERDMW